MSNTRGQREPFPGCGHRGYGKFCHRCVQATQMKTEADALIKLNSDDKKRIANLESESARLLTPPKQRGSVSLPNV